MRIKFSALIVGVFSAFLLFGCKNSADSSDEVVGMTAIPGVVAPVTGAEPVTSLDSSEYAGTISWNPAVSATFAPAMIYTATVTLQVKSGFTLSGVAANAFTVAGATATNAADTGVITAVFPATSGPAASDPGTSTSPNPITLTAIPGVVAPVTGAAPATSLDASEYAGTISWSPAVPGTFAQTTVYTATVTLQAKPGFTFSGIAANAFTVAGATATNAANSGVVTAVFPATAVPPKPIALTAIPGVTAPVTGATPVTSVNSSEYAGTIAWSPAVGASFAGGTVYTATVTLTPKEGYTAGGVAANGFTVAGAIATNEANSGVVTAVFPATVPTVSILAIPGVTMPVTGEMPITSLESSEYTAVVAWTPNPGVSFAPSTAYTARIVLTPKAGYTLKGVAANGFTVANATATNDAGFDVVRAVFPRTGPADYVSPTIGRLKGIPSGSFQRDATAGNVSVIGTAYRIGEKEITRDQFLAVMGYDDSSIANSNGMSDPFTAITLYVAIAFCNKLSIMEGLTPVYSVPGVNFETLRPVDVPKATDANWEAATAYWGNSGYRLPTEMEFMWAAMGARDGTTGYKKVFAGSTGHNAMGDYEWNNGNVADNKTRPVGTKLPNELGLYDMSGNVFELCWDWDKPWPAGTLTDYWGQGPGNLHRGHGGSFRTGYMQSIIGYQHTGFLTNGRYVDLGFRVVRR